MVTVNLVYLDEDDLGIVVLVVVTSDHLRSLLCYNNI